jgi:hypothetical protein
MQLFAASGGAQRHRIGKVLQNLQGMSSSGDFSIALWLQLQYELSGSDEVIIICSFPDFARICFRAMSEWRSDHDHPAKRQ